MQSFHQLFLVCLGNTKTDFSAIFGPIVEGYSVHSILSGSVTTLFQWLWLVKWFLVTSLEKSANPPLLVRLRLCSEGPLSIRHHVQI